MEDCVSEMGGRSKESKMRLLRRQGATLGFGMFLALMLTSSIAVCHGREYEDHISAQKVRRDVAEDGDVTTVLLVDNQKLNREYNNRNGRYLNVKPVIGLLTSTARTFIQDGVTTEYATQVLGTTLDNGRVYAQLLTKSSLVLYDKPSNVQDAVKRTRLPYVSDDNPKWNIEENLGDSLKDQFIIKNTDYVSPKDGIDFFTIFASKPIQESMSTVWNPMLPLEEQIKEEIVKEVEEDEASLRVQGLQEVPRISELETYNGVDPLPSARERKISAYNNVNNDIVIRKEERTDKSISFKSGKDNEVQPVEKTQDKEIDPVKVNPNIKLPTFTVKNEFSPIFYYIDNVESKTEKSSFVPNYLKSAKKLFGHKDEQKPMRTFTYYGFANFTTIVGDTVIVFSPSTAAEFVKDSKEEITPSAKPEVQPNVATKLKTFLSSDLNMVTKTMFGHSFSMETALPTFVMNSIDPMRSSKALNNQQANLKSVLYEKPMEDEEQTLKNDDKFNRVIASLKSGLFIRQKSHTRFGLHSDSIQPSETSSYSTIQRTHPTDKLQGSEETLAGDKAGEIKATEPLRSYRPSSIAIMENIDDTVAVTDGTLTTNFDESMTEGNDEDSTTESDFGTSPYTEDSLSTPQESEEEEEDSHSEDATCTGGIMPVSTMTTAYKTFTYLTTYFIPLEGTETTTSIKSHEVVSTETGYTTDLKCKTEEVIDIKPTATIQMKIEPSKYATITRGGSKKANKEEEEVTEAARPILTTSEKPIEVEIKEEVETTERMTTEAYSETTEREDITTESDETVEESTEKKVAESTPSSSVTTSESHVEMSVTTEETVPSLDNRNNLETTTENLETTTENDPNEVDLIFKTLYTTYTYFTTYFQGSTSTIASKKSVVTNVITSTLDLSQIDPSIFNAIESSDYLFKATQREELGDIQPTSVGIGRPTQTFALNSIIDLVQHRQVIDSVQSDAILSSRIKTPELDDEKLIENIKGDVVKTFYTTYTFFTTLFVEQDINICSRTEVYTNYVGPASLIPTKTSELASMSTKKNEIDFNNCKKVPAELALKNTKSDESEIDDATSKPKYHIYSSINRLNKKTTTERNVNVEDMSFLEREEESKASLNSGESMLVTDIKSSSSKGERQIIDNGVLDDQVSSESNIDEIMPSPTLLLQTSFTTFTYFTTMYIGKDSSKVKSRLETVTNVVTETLNPKSVEVEESNQPITYYTTFTYWTTLYKDKTTTITSREDIISNVVTPTITPSSVSPIETNPIEVATIQAKVSESLNETKSIQPSATVDDLLTDDGKATFFTTYTYFTTYYIGNTSELRSSLETITNIVDNTKDLVNENQIGRAVGKGSPGGNLLDSDEKPVIKNTALPDIIPTKIVGDNAFVSTQLVGTYTDNVGTDGKDKKVISSQVAIISGDSTVIKNNVEEKEKIDATKIDNDQSGDSTITTSGPGIEGSVTDPTVDQEGDDEDEDEEEEDEDGNTRKKSRLTFSTRKRTFTPVIRPFASRNRPTFSPKRVSLTSSATTITRSDFTPTITATPALKSVKTSGFGGNRKLPSSAYPGSSSAGGRRFTRINSGASSTSSAGGQRTTGFGRSRSSSTSDIKPTTSRRGGFRTSAIRASSAEFPSRGSGSRIRPTLSSRYRGNKQTTTPSLNNEDGTTSVTEDPTANAEDNETSTQASDVGDSRRTTVSRFKRPPFTRAPLTTTPRAPTQATTRRGSFNRNRSNGALTTTTRVPPRTTANPLFALRNRQRPNSLFPPRGLINKPEEPKVEEEVNEEENENQEDVEENADEDSDYESSDNEESQVTTTTTPAPRRTSNSPVIKPFGFRRRTRRQADYGTRRNFSNFRRPTARTARPEPVTELQIEVEITTPGRTRKPGRYTIRNSGYQNNNNPKPITRGTAAPTKPTSNARQPFIIRGESKTNPTTQRPSFRTRGSSATRPSARSSTAANLRPKAPRLKTYSNTQTESSRPKSRNSGRTRTTSRGRTTSRYRTTSNDIVDNNYIYQAQNDGKLTITHKIPMEVTIPVVNGKLTEYKNVLTAKPSLETLLPNQYSTTQNAFGSQYIVLVSEYSEPADNGATKVVQFILHETPTTSVIFTPTTIRGRKTSFSHIIPSTVYDVERVTSTIQPQINANVPLANILLSQLLLGNIGMPQPQINPLLAFQGQAGVPGTPTTETKTKTTTYVTTVTDAKSTVIPITLRGKEIFTTIIDSKVDVITATEFITETVVVTPTVGIPNQNPNQLNSILLLLQQQQIQQQQLQTQNPLLAFQPDVNLLQNNQQLFNNDLLNSPKPEVLNLKDTDDYLADYVEEDITEAPKRPLRRNMKPKKPTAPPKQSSVITLYVSGRTPGDFSTVLSTVYTDETQSVQKREALYFEEYDVSPSDMPILAQMVMGSQSDLMLDSFLMPAMDEDLMRNSITQSETQSLESIIGEVSKYVLESNSVQPTLTLLSNQDTHTLLGDR